MYNIMIDNIPFSIVHKIDIRSQCPWWTNYCWHLWTPLLNYKYHLGYSWLSSSLPMGAKLNEIWDLVSTKITWKEIFHSMWASYIKSQVVLLLRGALCTNVFPWLINHLRHLGIFDLIFPLYDEFKTY